MDRRVRKLARCRGARACGASRPAIRLSGTCDEERAFDVTGREKHRVRRIVGDRFGATVTMVDGRVATFDEIPRPACAG